MKRLYVFFLRMVAKRLLLPALEVVQTNYPLTMLTRVHDEIVQDGVMNDGRLLYFVRYVEEYQLTRDEWDALFTIQTFFSIYHIFFGITSVFQSGMNKKDGVNVVSFHVETAYQKDVLLLCTRISCNSTGKHFSSSPLYSFLLCWKSNHSSIRT